MKLLLTILLLSVSSCPSWAQEDDPELRKRFLRGVAQTARKLEQLSFRAKCAYTTQMTVVPETLRAKYAENGADPYEANEKKFEVALRGPFGLATGLRKAGNVFFAGRNDSYVFAIEQSPEGERTSLQFVEQIGINPDIDAQIAEAEGVPRAMVLAAYSLSTDLLFRLIEDNVFSIQRVYAVSSAENNLVRVEFEYLVDDPARGIKDRITDGFLICDPAQEWALTEYGGTRYNYNDEKKIVQRVLLELGESIGEIPIATKVLRTTNFLEYPGTVSETVITVEVTSHDDVPKEEFYLSFYGLPEPNFGETWFGTWGWYLIGGIACIAVGVVIKRRLSE